MITRISGIKYESVIIFFSITT